MNGRRRHQGFTFGLPGGGIPRALAPDDPPDPSGGGGNPPVPAPPAAQPVGITQQQLTAMLSREKDQGARSAVNALLTELGFDSKESAAAALKAVKDAADAQKSEDQKAKEAAEALARTAQEQASTAAASALDARKTMRLLVAGVPAQIPGPEGQGTVPNPALEMLGRMIVVDATADDAAIDSAVAAVKTSFPASFAAPAAGTVVPQQQQARPPAIPGQPPAPTPGSSAFGAGGLAVSERKYPKAKYSTP